MFGVWTDQPQHSREWRYGRKLHKLHWSECPSRPVKAGNRNQTAVRAPAAPPAFSCQGDFPPAVEVERVCPSGTGSQAVTALTFNASPWMAGTQNLPGRAHRRSKAGDLLRPRDLLETSICLSRGTGERDYDLTRKKCARRKQRSCDEDKHNICPLSKPNNSQLRIKI